MATIDEQHEFDDRFPAGEWTGFTEGDACSEDKQRKAISDVQI